MINIEAIKRVLESQGKLDFKPFHFKNAKQEYWAYKTNDNKFHICDSDLKEIEKRKLPIKSWEFCNFSQKILFVLDREQDYLFLEEGESVSTIQEKQSDNQIKNIWIIDNEDFIITKDIPGYRYIGDNWIILEIDIIEISNNGKNYWIPNRKIACYDPTKLEENNTFYCGSYNNDSYLFFCNGFYFMEYKSKIIGRRCKGHSFEKIVIWFDYNGILLVGVSPKNGPIILDLYEPGAGKNESGWDSVVDKCIGSHIINKNLNLSAINFFASDNVFVLSSFRSRTSSWISVDRYGNLGCVVKEKEGIIASLCNDIIKIDSLSYGEQGKYFEFYDYKGNCLAQEIYKEANYAIVTKSFETAIFVDEYKENKLLTLKGVLNTQNHKLVVPINNSHLELFDGGDFFYVIIGEKFTDETGTKAIQYGLLYNSDVVLPCNKDEVTLLSENLFVWKEEKKYGLICNGKKCTDCIYDNISEEKSIGRRKIRDKYLHDTYNYIKYSYAILQTDNKKGVFVPNWDILIPATYTEIKAFVEERAILADGKLFKIKERTLILDKDLSDFDYIGGLRGYHLFRRIGGDINDIDNYICFYLPDEDWMEECVWDVEEDDEIEADREHILWGNYRPVLALGDGTVFYSVKEDRFYDDINDLASYPDYYPDDDYDYERDTYYALGGDDYDQWKENGGDLDGMMEGMGF